MRIEMHTLPLDHKIMHDILNIGKAHIPTNKRGARYDLPNKVYIRGSDLILQRETRRVRHKQKTAWDIRFHGRVYSQKLSFCFACTNGHDRPTQKSPRYPRRQSSGRETEGAKYTFRAFKQRAF